MPLNIAQQALLRAELEKTTNKFFRSRQKVITAGPPQIDATGLLVVLSEWAGDLIAGAPEHMRDDLFMAFADNTVEIAGIKADEEPQQETIQ
jgi:hypothetical protein